MSLVSYLGKQILGVLACYKAGGTVIHICCVYPQHDNRLRLFFPRGHNLQPGELATLHLDNRSGVDEFDANIRVYRASYKGSVEASDGDWAILTPRECKLIHSMHVVEDITAEGYRFPDDPRPLQAVPPSPLQQLPALADRDHPNKVGILVTQAPEQPHTTVLAFLSSSDDDIFLITFPETFKSQQLKRHPRCHFVMDERASYTFERAIEWNYTIIEGDAYRIANGSTLFEEVRQAFIDKNPWEQPFFIHDNLEMYHIQRRRLLCPGTV